MFESRPFAASGRDKQTQTGGPIEPVVPHRQGSLCRNEAGISHLRISETRDLADEVISLHLPARNGYCDPAEPDMVQCTKDVEPGLARHRRSALREGWSFPVPQVFPIVNSVPYQYCDLCGGIAS
jgi:hypothetical protein